MKRRALNRILILNWRDPNHPDAGGAERYLLEVARSLRASGHEIMWLTAGFPGASRHDEVDGIPITRVGSRTTVYAAVPIYVLARLRGRFDAIIDAENGVPFFSPLFARVPIVCLIFHVHQRVFERHLPAPISTIFKWLEARAMPAVYRCARFIAISADTRGELIGLGVPERAIDLAYSGYDSSLKPGSKTSNPSIVYVGRMKKYKRVDAILHAFATVRRSIADATLVVVGTGDQTSMLRELAERLGLADVVRFEGFVDESRKRDLYAMSWLFVMASEMEGWGLTIVEAAACGTPTVAVSVPGVREAVVDGTTGILVSEPFELAEAMTKVLENDVLRARLSAAAQERAATFSWDGTASVIARALER